MEKTSDGCSHGVTGRVCLKVRMPCDHRYISRVTMVITCPLPCNSIHDSSLHEGSSHAHLSEPAISELNHRIHHPFSHGEQSPLWEPRSRSTAALTSQRSSECHSPRVTVTGTSSDANAGLLDCQRHDWSEKLTRDRFPDGFGFASTPQGPSSYSYQDLQGLTRSQLAG